MSDSARLIRSSFSSRRSSAFNLVIAQVDHLTVLAARLLKADFVAVFYRPRDNNRLLPLAYHDEAVAEFADLRLLEERWIKIFEEGAAPSDERFRISHPDSLTVDADDEFAAAYGFMRSRAYPCAADGALCGVLVAYWHGEEAGDNVNPSEEMPFLLEILNNTMSAAEEVHARTDFSLRLSELIAMTDLPIDREHFDEMLDAMLDYAQNAVPEGQYALFVQNTQAERFRLTASRGEIEPGCHFELALANEMRSFCVRAEQFRSHCCRWIDISDGLQQYHSSVLASAICLDASVRIVLIAWTDVPEGFNRNDRELLSAFSLFAQAFLKDALVLKNLTRSNRILRKSSQQLANFETLAALADMTSGVAHDFNNILGGVIGRIQLMKLRCGEEAVHDDLEKIEAQLLEGAETIKRLQTFTTSARPKETRVLDWSQVLNGYLQKDTNSWKGLATDKQVTVEFACRPDQVTIEGHDGDLEMMVEKLIENAVEHAVDDSTVKVSLEEAGKYYRLTVSNVGEPVPDDIQGKLFYPFFTTKSSRGAGLGLAIVHGIAIRLGGKVDFTTTATETRFSVWLVRTERADDVSEITRRGTRGRELRILVVDDDEQIREVLADMLSIDGHHPTACPDGHSALKAFEQADFDLMITDLGMPGMSGLQLAGTVHRSKPDLPIAMITGWGTQLNQDEVAINGIKAVLPKPFRLGDIKKLVETLVVA